MMKAKLIMFLNSVCLLAACSHTQKPVDLTASASQSKAHYLVSTVNEKALSKMTRLPGQLKPYNEVGIFPKVNGFIKKLLVDRGSIVRKGQLLMVLEAPEIESQLQAANSKYLQAQENAAASKEKYQRLKEASLEPGSVSPLDLDNASAKMKADEALVLAEKSNVASIRAMEEYLYIKAPFDGMIVERNVSPGALVSPGKETEQAMLTLQDIHKLRLEVYIPEDYVDKVDINQPVKFILNAMPGEEKAAKISRSSNALGSMHAEAIEIDVENKNGQLKPGMYAEVSIPMLSGTKSLIVPSNAIVRSTERAYVVTVKEGKAALIDIKEGLSRRDSSEVFGNLKAGDSILLNASDEIKDGVLID